MNRFNRTVFQLLLWAAVWIIMGLNQKEFFRFFNDNWIAYLFQSVLILALIYQLAPKLLFKNRHLTFAFISIGLLLICAFISGNLVHGHPAMDGPPPPPGFGRKNIPSPVINNLLLLSISYILAIFLETFSFAQKKEEALLLSKSENMENELKLLKSQINPHFLFNSLNNIYSLSMIDANKTQEAILHLSDMLRYVLYDCEKPLVSIDKEVTYIQDFIDLFMLKSSKKYPVQTQFSIENQSLQIAPMLLIPFVENAFKHSNIEKIDEAFLNINIHTTNETVHFTIENSFRKGPKIQDAVGGIGILNVQKRLNLLYPEKHSLLISENSTTFKVELKINTNA
jgi:two-component system, LytTR family, sensor kinase